MNPSASPMIRIVADAIESAGFKWKAENGGDSASWYDIPEEVFATAALEALRDPTLDMQHAGLKALDEGGLADCNCNQLDVWQAMIDAALASPPSQEPQNSAAPMTSVSTGNSEKHEGGAK